MKVVLISTYELGRQRLRRMDFRHGPRSIG